MIKNKKRKPRIIFGAGGTGGHLFPAQAVASKLMNECECLFVGGHLSQNRFFNKEQFSFREISAAPLALNPQKLMRLWKGAKESFSIIKEFEPNLVIGFGSYFTFPLLVASAIKRVPIFLHEQNALPGRVNRFFSPIAKTTAISFSKTKDLLNGKNIQRVAFPLRPKKGEKEPWTYFGLEKERSTVLVFGGSQGARVLNHLFMECAKLLPNEIQILHFTGDAMISKKASDLYKKWDKTFVVKEFEEKMECAFAVASIALTRAGASTIAELVDWQMPAILIPFPHAKDNHQYDNAKYFVESMKGGKLLFQEEVTPPILAETLLQLLDEKEERRKRILEYKNGEKLQDFSELILTYLNEEEKK